MNLPTKQAFCLALACLLAGTAQAVDYFVKTTGNNSNNGLTYATAFKTIQKALDLAAPGTTIFVEGGTYKERLWWPNSGSPGAPITLTNYSTAVVNLSGAAGGTNTAANEMLALVNISHARIQNIRILSNYRALAKGIYIGGAGTDIRVTNCRIYNIGWSTSKTTIPTASNNANPLVVVGTSATSLNDIQITGNQIYNCVTGYSESLTLVGNVENFLVEGNTVRDNTNIGIVCAGHYSWTTAPAAVNQARNGTVRGNIVYRCIFPGAQICAGIYVDGGKDILVERNKSYSNDVGFSIGCENDGASASGIVLRNNTSYNNADCGLYFGSNSATSTVENCSVTNNSLFQNYSQGGFGAEVALQNSQNNTFKQNIFVPRTAQSVALGIWGYTATNFNADYNLYWRIGGNVADMTANVGAGTHAVFGDPKFTGTNPAAPNLHLKTGSKAIHAGDPAFAAAPGELDFDGQTRVQQGRVDIGADETALLAMPANPGEIFWATEKPQPVPIPREGFSETEFSVFPNPAAGELMVFVPEKTGGRVSVLDLSGKLWMEKTLADGERTLRFEVENLSPGVYFVRAEMAEGTRAMKFLKQ